LVNSRIPVFWILALPFKVKLVAAALNPGKKSWFSWDETGIVRKMIRAEKIQRNLAMILGRESRHGRSKGGLDLEEVGEIRMYYRI
jgi:hypothetical protein